jgi:hypothetical protein
MGHQLFPLVFKQEKEKSFILIRRAIRSFEVHRNKIKIASINFWPETEKVKFSTLSL